MRIGMFLLSISGIICAQTIDEPCEVATWQGFRNAAISYTFDDGCSNQFSKAIPMFNEFGFCGTFFTVTNWSPNWTALQNAAAQGHEVASHTVSHPYLNTLDISEQIAELSNSANIIYDHIAGLNGMTIAYPYCVPGMDSLTSLYYFAARGCQGFIENSTPSDFLNISSIICGSEGEVNSTTTFNQKAEAASNSKGWCVYLIHGIDGDGGYSSLSSTILRESLEYLDQNKNKFWVAPFGDVVRYIRERNCLSVIGFEETNDTIRLVLSDTLSNDTLYSHPVTLSRPLPSNWEYAAGFQEGQEIYTTVVETSSESFIYFDAVPDRGEVLLIKCEAPPINSIQDDINTCENGLRIWVDQQNLVFNIPQTASPLLEVGLYNIMGVSVTNNYASCENTQVGSIRLESGTIKPGLYIVMISDGNKTWSGKVQIPDLF